MHANTLHSAVPLGEPALATAILGYLAQRPRAEDMLTGIAEWWLLRARVEPEVRRLAQALADLSAAGPVEQVGTGAEPRYRAAAQEALAAGGAAAGGAGGAFGGVAEVAEQFAVEHGLCPWV